MAKCACGCGRDVRRRYAHGHNRRRPISYTVDPETGCWVWSGGKSDGYGHFSRDGVHYKAHRYFYEQAKGPIPAGCCIDHLCRNHSCVNPDHLEAVHPTENVRRGNLTKLTAEQADEIRKLSRTMGRAEIAAAFGIDKSRVGQILRGVGWMEVPA